MNLFEIIYLTAPAWVSNTIVGLINPAGKPLPISLPLDFRLQLRGKRLFGNHRTIIGSILIIIVATVIGQLQNNLHLGISMGIFTLFGTLISSFIKRQIGIPEGKNLLIVDQIDYAVSNIIGLSFINYIDLNIKSVLIFTAFIFFYQFIGTYISFILGIKNHSPIPSFSIKKNFSSASKL